MRLQPLPNRRGQHRPTVLLSFAPANNDLMPVEVNVLHAQLQAFVDPEAGTVEEHDDDPDSSRQVFHDCGGFVTAEHERHTGRHTRSGNLLDLANVHLEHVSVHEEQRTQRLILRRRAHVLPHRQPGQKGGDRLDTEGRRMRLPVEDDATAMRRCRRRAARRSRQPSRRNGVESRVIGRRRLNH